MVSSSVHGFEDQLDQVEATLRGYGYEVIMSHKGTVRIIPGKHNFDACRQAVADSDIFLGIIRGQYGSGRNSVSGLADDEISVTHMELRYAVQTNKPRLFLVDVKVDVARQLLRPLRHLLSRELFDASHDSVWEPTSNVFQRNPILDDWRILDMYEEALLSETPLLQRRDHWCQLYSGLSDVLRFVEAQFRNRTQMRSDLNAVLTSAGVSGSR